MFWEGLTKKPEISKIATIWNKKLLDYLIQAAVGIAGIVVLFFGGKLLLTVQQNRFRKKQKQILLSIRVSRENEKLPIVAEQMFAVLHGIIHKISFIDRLCCSKSGYINCPQNRV